MKNTPMRIACVVPHGGATRHHVDLLQELRGLGLPVSVFSLAVPHRAPGLLLPLFTRLDGALSPMSRDPFAPAAIPGDVVVRELAGRDGFAAELARTARLESLDLLIVPGGMDLPPGVVTAFRLGALVLEHADFATNVPTAALHALFTAADHWTPRLVWHAPGRPPRVLYRSPSAVFPLSLGQTAAPACVKAVHFIPRMLRRLLEGGPAAWEDRAEELTGPPFPPPPGDAAMLGFLPRLVGRYLAAAWRSVLFRPQWFLGLRRGGGDPFTPRGFTPLFPPDASGWADPFPFVHEGKTHLFFEHIHKDTGLGAIAVMTETPDGGFSPPEPVLSAPHHLSYPFVFTWKDAIYMVPESGQAGRADLYRAVRFPLEWERAATLLEGVRAVDATLFKHEGRWWLVANLRQEGGSSWDELSAFYADTPLGPFTPHPGNPVVSDVRTARPAGRVFRHGGRLYRPAQDCSGHYGRGLAIQEIELLTPDAYRESTAVRYGAEILGVGDSLHTYAFAPGLETVDGRRFIPRLPFFRRPRP